MFEPYAQTPPPPAARAKPGTCRVCGCTEHHACAIDGGNALRVGGGCRWTDDTRTLCTRCHSTRQPTRYQINELIRIRALLGPTRIAEARAGELMIALPAQRLGMHAPPTLTLDTYGRIRRRPLAFKVGYYGEPIDVAGVR